MQEDTHLKSLNNITDEIASFAVTDKTVLH